MLEQIALRRLYCWIHNPTQKDLLQGNVLGFELGQLGFKITNIDEFTSIDRSAFEAVLTILREMRGGDVKYVPLFSRFPDELPNNDEYLLRRILGFFGINTFDDGSKFGADPVTQMQRADLWQAAVVAQNRRLTDERTEWITLTLVSQDLAAQKLTKWATDLVYGSTPIKEALWDDLFTILDLLKIAISIEQIQIKETLARLACDRWHKWGKIAVKTPTDLLRMFASIQGQDVSLAKPVDLKGLKFSKPQRREIITFLNKCPALGEDLLRYKKLWISISKWLHPGDFVKQFPAVAKVFDDLRNDRIVSFESLVINSPRKERIEHLLKRPAVLLRKLTWLLQEFPPEVIAASILSLKDKVDTLPLPLLMTAYFAIEYDRDRLVINKNGKPHTLNKRESLDDVSAVLAAIDTLIITKLQGTKDWDKVWIDPAIDKLVLPLQARKQSDGLLNLARGSRISIFGENSIQDTEAIRLFIYWQETSETTDLDLSVMKLDPEFNSIGHVGWNDYGSGKDIAHSGDIQSAPMGAAEFIDLRLAALEDGYILPSVMRFAGEEFSAMKACYAGWMKRTKVGGDTQTFDAKTVAEKVDVNQDGQVWIPFLLDVAAKEIIYVDIYSKGERIIEGNKHLPALASTLASYWQARPTFGALARWYAKANDAKMVELSDATITIGISDDRSINVLKLVGQGVTSFYI